MWWVWCSAHLLIAICYHHGKDNHLYMEAFFYSSDCEVKLLKFNAFDRSKLFGRTSAGIGFRFFALWVPCFDEMKWLHSASCLMDRIVERLLCEKKNWTHFYFLKYASQGSIWIRWPGFEVMFFLAGRSQRRWSEKSVKKNFSRLEVSDVG